MHTNCSILPKARNEIVMRFMASGYDKLLFLDNDLAFNAVDVFKLIKAEHDICAIDYRKKHDKRIEFAGDLTGRERDGWLQAASVGAGLLCISRGAIAKMQQDNPETRYVTDDGDIAFSLFDFLNYEGRYWGEDNTFCRRAVASGFDISVLKDAETQHIGIKAYGGNRNDNNSA